MALPTVAGQRVTDGVLYRFIPNLSVYWEYDRDRPSPRAFRSRPGENDGVSMYIEGHTTLDHLKSLQPSFGICGIHVGQLLQEKRLSVTYDPDETLPEGKAHVIVGGVNRRVAEWIAREVAYRVKPPDPPVQSLTTPVVETEP